MKKQNLKRKPITFTSGTIEPLTAEYCTLTLRNGELVVYRLTLRKEDAEKYQAKHPEKITPKQ